MDNTLLRIDSSLRTEESYSRHLGDFFIKEWKKRNPTSRVHQRDLSKNPINHLNQKTIEGFFGNPKHVDLLKTSNELIKELFDADDILITVPMYNFGIPSALKAYFDQVVRIEKTYTYQNRPLGLLKNKKAYIISSMGGEKGDTKSLVEIHLQTLLSYIGITEIHFLTIDGTVDQTMAMHKIWIKQNEIINLLNH